MTLSDRILAPRRLWFALAVAHMTLIAWSSHHVWDGAAPRLPGVGNLMHVPLYFALGFMTSATLGVGARPVDARSIPAVLAVAWAGAFGIADEIHQSFVPGRSCSVRDAIVDVLAAAAAVMAIRAWAGDPSVRGIRAAWASALVVLAVGTAVVPDLAT